MKNTPYENDDIFETVNKIQIQIQFDKNLYWILYLQIRIWICAHHWLSGTQQYGLEGENNLHFTESASSHTR